MKVETYEIEETTSEAGIMASDAEAIELCEKLGLKGQQKLANPDTLTRFAYPRVTAAQTATIAVLFPESQTVQDYDQGIIPIRVLQVIAHCQEFPQTKHLTVHHARSIKEDPVLIGSSGPYNSTTFLLARWGDALPSWDELIAKAAPIFSETLKIEIQQHISKLNSYLLNAENLARVYLATGTRPTISIYD